MTFILLSFLVTVGVDYTSSIFDVTLLSGETRVCTTGILLDDTEFEGTESFYLLFTSDDSTIVFNTNFVSSDSASSIRTQVFILDNSGMKTHE